MMTEKNQIPSVRDIIARRKSTRNFDPVYQIPRNIQEDIISAGLRAPSPKNRQPWYFYVLDDRKKQKKVSDLLKMQLGKLKSERMQQQRDTSDLDMAVYSADIIADASMIVFVGYERDSSNEHGEKLNWGITAQAFEVGDLQSIGAAVQNMLLAAMELGIASLWMCDVLYAHDEIRTLLKLNYPFVAAVAFGRAGVCQSSRKNISEKTTWLEEG